MKSWKTFLFGILSAVGVGMLSSSNPTLHTVGTIIGMIGSGGLGVAAKDSNVTGGTKQQ